MRTIQNVVDTIMANINCAHLTQTVDTFKSGDPSVPVKGIVTTFTATWDVLQRTVAAGANFIITHEPTFYGHEDKTAWLAGNQVYEKKKAFLEENGITIWRFHDHWHYHQPDGIYTGVIRKLGWEGYGQPTENFSYVFELPQTTLKGLATSLKERLDMKTMRIIGREQMPCQRIGLMVGGGSIAFDGETIKVMNEHNLDVLVCGEIVEWTTCEYIRDAVSQGLNKGLIVLGHERSEEAGMEYLAEWLKPLVPEVPVTFISAGEPFDYL